jgi:hypothetical protein
MHKAVKGCQPYRDKHFSTSTVADTAAVAAGAEQSLLYHHLKRQAGSTKFSQREKSQRTVHMKHVLHGIRNRKHACTNITM